jgi:GNAT superfamily N-acetyltransferase
MAIPPLTKELIHRLERFLARGVLLDPDGAVYATFGDIVCSKAKGGKPRNKVFGLNYDDIEQLPRALAFYAHDRLQPTVYLTPASFHADLATALAIRGFAQREFEQAILYGVPDPNPPSVPQGMAIEPVTADNRVIYAETMAAGHEWDASWRDAAVSATITKLATEKTESAQRHHRFLARLNGAPVGVAAMEFRDGIAALGAGGVIPAFRNMGVHSALLRHRLHLAHQLGAELIGSGANVGSTSFRNQQRAGLQIAYIESGWRRAD